jgi:hypothetical protein
MNPGAVETAKHIVRTNDTGGTLAKDPELSARLAAATTLTEVTAIARELGWVQGDWLDNLAALFDPYDHFLERELGYTEHCDPDELTEQLGPFMHELHRKIWDS